MSKPISLALIIVILATIAIAEPNQVEITEVQQGANSVPVAECKQVEADQLEMYNLLNKKIIELEKQIQQTKEEIDKKFSDIIRYSNDNFDKMAKELEGLNDIENIGIELSNQKNGITGISKNIKRLKNVIKDANKRDCSIATGNILFHSSHHEVFVLFANGLEPARHAAYRQQYAD